MKISKNNKTLLEFYKKYPDLFLKESFGTELNLCQKVLLRLLCKSKKGNKKMKITIDSADVKIENGRVTIDVDSTKINDILNIGKVELSTLKPGDEFNLGDEAFIVLEQTDNGTRVISKEFAYNDVKFGDNSNWNISPIRRMLNNEYFKKIAAIIGENNIISMDRDLTSLDGLDDYGTCTDKVSLLTAAEYAKYHKILGLKSNYPDWWWLITPASTPSNNYARRVCYVDSFGVLDWRGCGCTYGVRPFLNLESSISVLLNKD